MNYEKESLIEAVVSLFKDKKKPQNIKKIIKETLEKTGVDDPTGDIAIQLYIDIITSSKFVYCGEENWDLKERESLELWDKDGSFFNTKQDDAEEENEDEITEKDYYLEDEAESTEEEVDESDDEEEVEVPSIDEEDEVTEEDSIDDVTPEDDFDDSDDEDDDIKQYNKYMDDYEDMYDE